MHIFLGQRTLLLLLLSSNAKVDFNHITNNENVKSALEFPKFKSMKNIKSYSWVFKLIRFDLILCSIILGKSFMQSRRKKMLKYQFTLYKEIVGPNVIMYE